MLTFNQKFYFSDGYRLAEITEQTLGATVYADGGFEAAADSKLDGKPLPISQNLVVRVTAHSDRERAKWAWKLLEVLGEDASLDTTEKGYWQPTDEYEPSWKLTSHLAAPTPELYQVIYDWLVEADQQSVYLEWAGSVVILDRDEVPAFIGTAIH